MGPNGLNLSHKIDVRLELFILRGHAYEGGASETPITASRGGAARSKEGGWVFWGVGGWGLRKEKKEKKEKKKKKMKRLQSD